MKTLKYLWSLAIVIFVLLFVYDLVLLPQPEKTPPRVKQEEMLPQDLKFILIGVDKRPQEPVARADTIILVSINQPNSLITALSIPRDTRVEVKPNQMGKINTVYPNYGGESLAQVVGELLGENVNRYVQTDFEGFKNIVDILGGVEIDVEKNMSYKDDIGLINLKKGKQLLNGEQALQYVRFRYDALGDISRTGRQLKFIKALANEALQIKHVLDSPKLLAQLKQSIDNNFDAKEKLFIANVTKNFGNYRIVTQTLPGSFLDYQGISYWSVDREDAKLVYKQLQQGQGNQPVVK